MKTPHAKRTDTAWIEISLTVADGELSESVAEVLSRYIPDGVFIQATGIIHEPNSHGRAIGPYRVCGYIQNGPKLEETRSKVEEALWFLGRISPLPEPEYKNIQETNWVDAWKQHYTPIPVGKKLTILPIWEENPRPDTIPIFIDPGMAFGTGTHPSTQLAMELMERLIEAQPPNTLIDIGCGSAILSIAAGKLGVAQNLGVDIDGVALDNARLNVDLNKVDHLVELGTGSVFEVLRGDYSLQKADLVVANILAHILIMLMDEGLARLVAPGGRLILSGILDERVPDILRALETHNLRIVEKLEMGDWVALAVEVG